MKKTITLFIVLVMALAMVACSSNKDSDDNQTDNTPSVTKPADKPSDDKASNDKADGENNSNSENNSNDSSEFLSWTDVDMVNYLKAEGVFTDDSLLYTQTEGEEAPIGVSKCISYMDDYFDSYIVIFWLDPNAPTDRTEEIYEEIKTTQTYIMTEAGDFPQPFNTLIGRFAFFYSYSFDEEIVDKTTAALDKLSDEYGVTPDFINMDIEEPEYDYDDDDVIYVD